MAERTNVDAKTAEDTVFGNLGIDPPDGDDQDIGGDDDDDGIIDDPVDRRDDGDLDDMRVEEGDDDDVSHTPADERLPGHRIDKKGNIVSRKGQVLAKAGAEARLYRSAYKAQRDSIALRGANGDLKTRLGKAIDIGTQALRRVEVLEKGGENATGKELGLNAAEQVEAFQLFALGKKDPKDLLKKILTRAAIAGIDTKDLGLQGGSFDAKSLSETLLAEIDKRMTPLKETTARQTEEQAARAKQGEHLTKANEEVETFFGENPAALRYLPIFRRVYSEARFAHMSLSEAWARIQLNLLRSRRNNPDRRSRPQGRRSEGAPVGGELNLDKDYGQILNEILDEA